MTTRLIVGFDGSDHSRVALDWAAREAERRDAAVRVVTAYAAPPVMSYYGIHGGVYSPKQYGEAAEQYRRQAVEAVAKVVAEHPTVGIDIEVVDAFPADPLLHGATIDDLIVVGSSGSGSVKSFLLGSVVASVLHSSPCPVVVTPASLRLHIGKIAVGIDGSAASDRALRWAATEAELWSSDLVVVHAWEYPYRLADDSVKPRSEATRVDASLTLDRGVETARELTPLPIERRLLEGGTTEQLLDLSAEADMIVLGSRGRGGFKSMVLGSVTMAVAAHAYCPVVVVPNR